MKKKLIFFDIDGTLVAEGESKITESAVDAMKMAQAKGHLCFVNTGRPMGCLGSAVLSYPFDGYICGCGTHIIYHGKEILHVEIEPEQIANLIKWNQKENIDIFFEGQKGLTFPPESAFKDLAMVEEYFKRQNVDVQYYQYEGEINFRSDKFSLWFDKENLPYRFRSFLEQFFTVIERAEDFWEVIPKGYSKATGIDELLKYLDMDLTDTISIGDSSNDIEMLKHTKESVLMGNGSSELKKFVTYVTTDIQEDGVYWAMKHFDLI